MSDIESSHVGVLIDIATCSQCEEQEIFEKPKQLSHYIGSDYEGYWTCEVPENDPDGSIITCPDCTDASLKTDISKTYVLPQDD